MKIGCSSWSFSKFFEEKRISLPEFISKAAKLGCEGVELNDFYFQKHFGGPGVPVPDDYLKSLMEEASSSGIEICAIAVSGSPAVVHNLEEKKKRAKDLKMWTEVGGKLEVPVMRVTTGFQAEGIPYAKQVHWVRDIFKECIKTAEDYDIVYAIEPHDSICHSAEGLIWLIESVGSERLGACPDPLNWGIQPVTLIPGQKPIEAIYVETERIAPYTVHAHAKMSTFDEKGEVYVTNPVTKEKWHLDYERIINIFRKAGFEGYQALEIYGEGKEAPEESVKKGVALLRKYV